MTSGPMQSPGRQTIPIASPFSLRDHTSWRETGARFRPARGARIRSEVTMRAVIEDEARAASRAAGALGDDAVTEALGVAARLISERKRGILAANAADVEAARERLDEGTLDRLRLDEARVQALAAQAEAMARVPPLEREAGSWVLANGLRVSERRIPIGTVGANFEARPNVALDVAGQLLRSQNTAVLRTGGAALGTVTVLVDDVLRPALEGAGLPGEAVGLVRTADREGARVLCSMPRLVPLVILRGSGETTAQLARYAAEHGVRTLAHAAGGGVLYVHGAAAPEKALAIAEASLDRLGVCNRLNLCLVDRQAAAILPSLLELLRARGLEVRGDVEGAAPLDKTLGHEWASDPDRVTTVTVSLVDSLDDAVRVANEETSGLAAGIVTEDASAAERFLDGYRGTAAYWHATTRFTDGFELTGAPETGINVDWVPGPRGPVTYRDLWLRQYRVVGDATQHR
jgi:glutamate-5-semialdehyde dehydrogenase